GMKPGIMGGGGVPVQGGARVGAGTGNREPGTWGVSWFAVRAGSAQGWGLLPPALADRVEQFEVGLGQGGFVEEVGAALQGAAEGLLAAPFGDLGVVAGEQDVRDLAEL